MLPKHNFVGLDIETGGFNAEKNAIEEICMIAVDFEFKEIKTYIKYVQNELNLEITKEAKEIHGIKESDLINGISLKQLYTDIVDFLKALKTDKYFKGIIIGHKVGEFDLRKFIEWLFNRFNDSIYNYICEYIYDTLYTSRIESLGKEVEGGFTLQECCLRAGIEISDGHSAENDVRGNIKLAEYQIKNKVSIESEEKNTQEGARGKFFI